MDACVFSEHWGELHPVVRNTYYSRLPGEARCGGSGLQDVCPWFIIALGSWEEELKENRGVEKHSWFSLRL